jgi:hypothetical protein
MFLKVVLDVSSCSPWRATDFAELLQVLHNLLAASSGFHGFHGVSGSGQNQADARASTAATRIPAARRARTDSRAVAPVVTMSSTSTTSVPTSFPG